LVHILNRSFQDGGPILHDDSFGAGSFGDEEDYCSFGLVGNRLLSAVSLFSDSVTP